MKLLVAALILSLFMPSGKILPEPLCIGAGTMPSLTTDAHQNIHLVYGSHDSLFYRVSSDKGKSFSDPQLVSADAGILASFSRGPQITCTKKGIAVVAPLESGSIVCFVKEGKNSWRKTATITDADSVAMEGFVSVASDADNKLFAVWLDVRDDHHNKIYESSSADGGNTWSSNFLIYTSPDSTVCECCKPSVAVNGKKVYVMFRNNLHGNRDMHLILSSDFGATFGNANRIGFGSWPLKGCPMDGGGLVVNANNEVMTVWRREKNIYTCEPGKQEISVGEGRGCAIEKINNDIALLWMNNGNILIKTTGKPPVVVGKGDAPVMKAVRDHLVIAWQNDKQIFVQSVKPD